MTIRSAGELARFAYESNKISASRAHRKLFEPNKKNELSVGEVNGLNDSDIQQLGKDYAALQATPKPLYGWAEINESAVKELGLEVVPDTPPIRHANIVNWPTERQVRKTKTQQLANASTPIKLPRPIRP